MHAAQFLHRDLTVLRLEIKYLPADHALGTGGAADLVRHTQECLGGYILLPQDHGECKREECIPRKNRNAVAVYDVICRLAAPQIIIVHRGQIIVNERIRMNHLECARNRQELRSICTNGIRRRHQEDRTQPFPACHEAVLHRRTQRIVQYRSLCEFLPQSTLYQHLPLFPEFLHLSLRSAAFLLKHRPLFPLREDPLSPRHV